MDIMLYLGRATPRIITNLKSMSDAADFSTYTSVSGFVQEAELRNLFFNRIVFNNKFVANGESDFVRLNEFIREFSSATELIMVIESGDKNNESLFNKYFSSPMHSCAIVKGASTMDFFKSLVYDPVVDIKARYYTLDKGLNDAVTAKSLEGQGKVSVVSKISTETDESSVGESGVAQPPSFGEILPTDTTGDSPMSNSSEVASNAGFQPVSAGVPIGSGQEYLGFLAESSPLVGDRSSPAEDFDEFGDDDLLSLGAFGSAHSDTGVFDDEVSEGSESVKDLEAERQRNELARQTLLVQEGTKVSPVSSKKKRSFESPDIVIVVSSQPEVPKRKTSVKKQWSVLRGTPYTASRVNFMVSSSASLSAQRVVDDAVRMMEAGMRVLVVDLDFARNALLSFVDVDLYYAGNHNWYIGGSLYSEENVDIISGGYGFVPSNQDVLKALKFAAESDYDIVLVDCPVSSLPFVEFSVLASNNIVIYSGKDPSQAVSLAMDLSNRLYCSLQKERLIMSTGRTLFEEGVSNLVEESLSKLYFANGSFVR